MLSFNDIQAESSEPANTAVTQLMGDPWALTRNLIDKALKEVKDRWRNRCMKQEETKLSVAGDMRMNIRRYVVNHVTVKQNGSYLWYRVREPVKRYGGWHQFQDVLPLAVKEIKFILTPTFIAS